jgi:surface antigen
MLGIRCVAFVTTYVSKKKMKKVSPLFWLAALFFLMEPALVSAEPPPWAPAHGHRNKHKGHDDEHGHEPVIAADIGIGTGTCNRDAVGAVLGGVVGGVVGAKIGKDQGNKDVGLVLGAIVGAVVGQSIGKQMDDTDKQCTVQVLEQAKNGQTVVWTNPQIGMEYRLTPVATYERSTGVCRKYVSQVVAGQKREKTEKMACRATDGTWRVSNAS